MHIMRAVPDKLLATVEVAERLGVERSVLTRWVQLGKITVAHRLPGKTGAMLFDPVEVDRVAAELAAEQAEQIEASA